jgi:phytoene dehydrogenase-like protein
MDRKADVVVVGGGLAGLAAATYLARTGRSVAVLEKGAHAGGRARTRAKNGFLFNLGPHALYRGGAASAVLRELGVPFHGQPPDGRRVLGVTGLGLDPLPVTPAALVTSRLMGLSAKWELARLTRRLPSIDASAANGLSLAAWTSANIRHAEVAELLHTLFRVSTYTNDPERMSAGAALAQLQLGLGGGVLYLDGGWRTLVDGLLERAREAGVRVETHAEVAAVEHDGSVRGVRLRDGERWTAPVVVSTLPPPATSSLPGLEGTAIARIARTRVPVRAATLDLGLRRLPRPQALVAFGLPRPLYFSVHSAVARLAPEGGALVHAMLYLGNDVRPPQAVESELEALVDRVQPGWRDEVVERRFVPDLLVANALPVASEGGFAGRPGVTVPERTGLFVAGDWVGTTGQLADASLASARAAAAAIVSGTERVAAA